MPAHASYPEDLALRLLKAKREYEPLKAAAHAAVDHWVLTNNERFTLRLHFFERERQRIGELLTQAPRHGTYYRYGMTVDDLIVVEECYQKGTLVYEAFWQHTFEAVDVLGFAKGNPVFIAKLERVNGLPSLYRHYAPELRVARSSTGALQVWEFYTHWDARRTSLHVENGRVKAEYEVFYTPEHEIERIDMATGLPAGQMATIYRGMAARQPTSTPAARRQAIVHSIVEAVANEHVTATVCGLMLNYTEGAWFPPGVVLLYEADREAYLAENPPVIELIWNAEAISPGHSHYITLLNALDLWEDLAEELQANVTSLDSYDDAVPRAALADIARDLMTIDWMGKLPISDDFVAFALDFEADSVQERLAASVPQDKLDRLRERGLW